ncbi:MAG: alanine--tRNA ligase [Armatimonadetes bacterium]|nr:alanine--tRNA ligase [Armatimonadota bacterium]
MTVRELREKYLRFFESKGHTIHDSGSLIPVDVTGRLDETLLFNGAGMVQFKPYFRGIATPPNKRLVTAQKCVRTGDIDGVGDDSHLTFFEMLGNFSFGDYFKKDAIAYSWEFLTSKEWLGLDPKRLSFTVFEEDDVAFECWSSHLKQAGIDPSTRIFKLDEETNYWPAGSFTKGPPGPCGPNSEMFYWTNPSTVPGTQAGDYSREQWIADDEAKNWLEIWNDVFIQFEWQGVHRNPDRPSDGYEKTGMPDLPFQSIDTGMGMERTVAVLSGKTTVYDTDAFLPILNKIDSLRALTPQPPLPSKIGEGEQTAKRIIADHIRTSCFCIADGVLPANNGRGYVLRRLIRRAVLKGQRVLGFNDLFMHEVAEAVFDTFGDHYKELIARREVIEETLKSEEALFRKTLDRGQQFLAEKVVSQIEPTFREFALSSSLKPPKGSLLEIIVDHSKNTPVDSFNAWLLAFYAEGEIMVRWLSAISEAPGLPDALNRPSLSGKDAFQLYDTYGFPLEVTQEICAEKGILVDINGYEAAMKEAQERSRGAQGEKSAYSGMSAENEQATDDAPVETIFTGYQDIQESATLVRIRPVAAGKYKVALDRTPFYGESGGQTGDTGEIRVNGTSLIVENTTKSAGTWWHDVIGQDVESLLGKPVEAIVDAKRRARIKRNHTATHLLQAALRQVLGTSVTQAGSYVGPDNLRFDFTHGRGMTAEEIAEVEQIVNDEILKNIDVTTYVDLPIDEARSRGAMALFGEKYGDKVRMVEVGDFSRELCGGIHVRTTGEIGLFKIVSESSAASGVRRIEAITGEGAYEFVREETEAVKEAANLLKSSPRDLVQAVERALEQLKDERKRREKAEMAAMSGGSTASDTVDVGGVTLWVKNFGDADSKIASQAVDNEANGKPNQVTLAAVVGDKVTFICKVGPDAVAKGAHAGNLVREIAKIAGGGGGGRPDFATAGGKDPGKVEEALAAAEGLLKAQL